MVERGPLLAQLQTRLTQQDQALEKVRSAREQLANGAPNKNPLYNLSDKDGPDYVDTAERIDLALQKVDAKLPVLSTRRQRTEEELLVAALDSTTYFDESVKAGRLSPAIAEEAKRQLTNFIETIIPREEVVQTEEIPAVQEPAAAEELTPLTGRQMAILCTQIRRKDGWYLKFGNQQIQFKVNDDCLGVCHELDDQGAISISGAVGKMDIQKERQEALGAMRDLVDSIIDQDQRRGTEGRVNIFDQLPPQLQHLVLQFLEWEDEFSATNLYEFLASITDEMNLVAGLATYDDALVREFEDRERVWHASQPFPEKITTVAFEQEGIQSTIPASQSVVSPHVSEIPPITVEEVAILGELVPETQPLVESTLGGGATTDRRLQREEIRRGRIKECLSKVRAAIDSHALMVDADGLVWGSAGLSRAFGWLTSEIQDSLIERRIIKPMAKTGSRTSGKVPGFTKSDIAVALYSHEFDRQITAKIARDLEGIIAEELNPVDERAS